MKYRAEIDGLRALAVVPVILFHAGSNLFSGGFVGVDIFFVISGYLISTILIDDIENDRFSLVKFYERRARRILPALFLVLLVSTIVAYSVLYPSDLLEYGRSLVWVLFFVSNIFFLKNSDYFATDSELTPLLHTWSLAVEEQFYLVFPIFLFLTWRYGKSRMFWLIVAMAFVSLIASEWGWRNQPIANFYLGPTRVWELCAGSIAAFIMQKRGVQKNDPLSLLGLAAIIFPIFAYDETTPFPSVYTLIPVTGVVLLLLYAEKTTLVAKLLSTRVLVGIGLISYSSYLWHQPIFVFYRRLFGIDMGPAMSLILVGLTFVLSIISWKYVEQPFRNRSTFTFKNILTYSACASGIMLAVGCFLIFTGGAGYRFDFPTKPQPWSTMKCHGAKSIQVYKYPLLECLGAGNSSSKGDIYLVGDSHAAQLVFAIKHVAEKRGVGFFFINTEDWNDYPYSFWDKEVKADRLLDHVLKVANPGDFFITSFYKGRLNPKGDKHYDSRRVSRLGDKAMNYEKNMRPYLALFEQKGVKVLLVKDGPLLSDENNSLEACMYEFLSKKAASCQISFDKDNETRFWQNTVFDKLAKEFDTVRSLDYSKELYVDGYFSPITRDGKYLMFDRHYLTELGSMMLANFFDKAIISSDKTKDK